MNLIKSGATKEDFKPTQDLIINKQYSRKNTLTSNQSKINDALNNNTTNSLLKSFYGINSLMERKQSSNTKNILSLMRLKFDKHSSDLPAIREGNFMKNVNPAMNFNQMINKNQMNKFKNYRNNVNFNMMQGQKIIDSVQNKKDDLVNKKTINELDTLKSIEKKEKIVMKHSSVLETEKFDEEAEKKDLNIFSSIENIQIERQLERENEELTKEKDNLKSQMLILYKEVNSIRHKIDQITSEKKGIESTINRFQEKLNNFSKDFKENEKTTIQAKNRNLPLSSNERFIMEYNKKHLEFQKFKDNYQKKISQLDYEIAFFNSTLISQRSKIDNLEEKISNIDLEITQVRNTLLLYYHRLLSFGVDARSFGLHWVIIAIWKLESNVAINYLPFFFDRENSEYLFINAHLTIIYEKAKFWLYKLKEDLKNYNKNLNVLEINEAVKAKKVNSVIKKENKEKVGNIKSKYSVNNHYFDMYYKKVKENEEYKKQQMILNTEESETMIELDHTKNEQILNSIENGMIKKKSKIDRLRKNTDLFKSMNYNSSNNDIESKFSKNDSEKTSVAKKINLMLDNKLSFSELKQLKYNNNKKHLRTDLEGGKSMDYNSLKFNHESNKEILNKIFFKSIDYEKVLIKKTDMDSSRVRYISNIKLMNSLMKENQERTELIELKKLIDILFAFVNRIADLQIRIKNIEVNRINEENINVNYNEEVIKFILKGLFGEKFWKQEYSKIITLELNYKKSVLKCQLFEENNVTQKYE